MEGIFGKELVLGGGFFSGEARTNNFKEERTFGGMRISEGGSFSGGECIFEGECISGGERIV